MEDNAWDMIKNTDCCIIINREIDDTVEPERQYMGFKLEKFRGKPNKDRIYVFLHPFDENNGILLTPDIDGKVLSRLSIEDFNPLSVNNLNKGASEFKDYESENDEFMSSFIDIVTNDYKDTNKNFVALYKSEEEVYKKMVELQKREKEIREKRKREKKDFKNKHNLTIIDKKIKITRKKYEVVDKKIKIHRKQK